MKAMNKYNRALDYTVLALNELSKGNATLAARLLAKAVEQKDVKQAIATIEASNRHAFNVQAKAMEAKKKPVKAAEECEEPAAQEEAAVEDVDFSEDPLNEIESESDEEKEDFVEEYQQEETEQETPAEAMAKVLSKMVRKSRK